MQGSHHTVKDDDVQRIECGGPAQTDDLCDHDFMSFRSIRRRGVRAALLLLLAAPAGAQVPMPTAEPLPPEIENQFRAADLDRDGSLSKQEAQRGKVTFSEQFDSIDADRNGIVTLFELGARLQTSMRRWLSDWDAADKDRDGKLSADEVRAAPSSVRSILTGSANAAQAPTRDQYESLARRQLYRNVDMPSVVPNIFEKRF